MFFGPKAHGQTGMNIIESAIATFQSVSDRLEKFIGIDPAS